MNVKALIARCSKCGTPCVLRYSVFLFGGGSEWLYQRDCKCRGKDVTIVGDGREDEVEWAKLRVLGVLDDGDESGEAGTLVERATSTADSTSGGDVDA